MRWLVHAAVTPAAVDALRRHGHQTHTAAEAKVDPAGEIEILKQAHKLQLDVITGDPALVAAALGSKSAFGRSIVFLQLAGGDVEQDDAIDRLFKRYKRLTPGRLYTVTETRVKIRQLPGKS
jgi:hypothetical protein